MRNYHRTKNSKTGRNDPPIRNSGASMTTFDSFNEAE